MQQQILHSESVYSHVAPLALELALTFVEGVYYLIRTKRAISIYRGYETAGLDAPYGKDHASFFLNLVSHRQLSKPDGLWWMPSRPSMEIDDLKLPEMHRAEYRAGIGVTKEWNRLDYYLASELPPHSVVYVGRAAPKHENAAYGGTRYGGYSFQFRLTAPSEHLLPWMRRYEVH